MAALTAALRQGPGATEDEAIEGGEERAQEVFSVYTSSVKRGVPHPGDIAEASSLRFMAGASKSPQHAHRAPRAAAAFAFLPRPVSPPQLFISNCSAHASRTPPTSTPLTASPLAPSPCRRRTTRSSTPCRPT